MNYTKAIKEISNAIADFFESKQSTLPFDITFKAKVTAPTTNGYCKVLYNGKEYKVNSSISCQTNDFVMVCAPQNNWAELFVAAKRGK